jgi:hypothetical protein
MAVAKLLTVCTTPRFRLSYPSVFEPQLNKLSGKMEYSLQALFEETSDLTELKLMAKNACINKWGPDMTKWPSELAKATFLATHGTDPSKWPGPCPQLKMPFKSQKELIVALTKKEQPHAHLSPNAVFMTFKTGATGKNGKPNPKPRIVGKNPKEEITEPSKFYGGCWAKANVNAGAYDHGGNYGVTFYLNAAQFVADGEPFGGRPNVEAAFEAIPEDAAVGGVAAGGPADATSMFT